MAPVAKSTIVPITGKNIRSRINGVVLIRLDGCPAAGFVLWQSLTRPSNIAGQELKEVAMKTIATNFNNVPIFIFFNLILMLKLYMTNN